MAFHCPHCPVDYKTEWHRDFHLRATHGYRLLNPEEYAALSSASQQNSAVLLNSAEEAPMTECPLCVHNSDTRTKAEVALALAQKELADLQARYATVENALATLQQAPSHPPGLCGLDTCEPCNTEIGAITQAIVPVATAEGRRAALSDVRQALTWGGGEALADKVTQYAQAWVQKGRPEPAKEPALVILG